MTASRAGFLILLAALAAAIGRADAVAAQGLCDPPVLPTRLCLVNGRFAVEVTGKDAQGAAEQGEAIPLTDASDGGAGTFRFSTNGDPDFAVKILKGSNFFSVYYAGLTNREVKIKVTDTFTIDPSSPLSKTYCSAAGTFASFLDPDFFPVFPVSSGQTLDCPTPGGTVAGNSASSKSRRLQSAQANDLVADFNYTVGGNRVMFIDKSSGGPDHWCWTFGDETGSSHCTSEAQSPGHTYAHAGCYSVHLSISRSDDVSVFTAETEQTIDFAGTPALAAGFSFSPARPQSNRPVTFTDRSTGSPTRWCWTFGDETGSGCASTQRNPVHTYTAARRSYTVHLTVGRGDGASAEAEKPVTVTSAVLLVAGFFVTPTSPHIGEVVSFSDTSAGNPDRWSWSFGDGGSSTQTNPVHVYTAAGTFLVRLTVVRGSDGATAEAQRLVTVLGLGGGLVAGFSFDPAVPRSGDEVRFTDHSTGNPDRWCWTFGDETGSGCASQEQDPVHAYATAGTYTVHLTVGRGAQTAAAEKPVTVTPCSVTPDAESATVGPGEATYTVHVDAALSCRWIAASNAPFLHVTAVPTDPGPGDMTYRVDANTTLEARTGTLTIGDVTFTVTQRSCLADLGLASDNLPLPEGCDPSSSSLCLLGRFEVRLVFYDPDLHLSGASAGYFVFFAPPNPEVVLKIEEPTPPDGSFGVFFGSLSDRAYLLSVYDGERTKRYCNPQGTFHSVGDPTAFPPPSP